MSEEKPTPDESPAAALERKLEERPPIIQAAELFQGHREIWIEHAGIRYRLHITRRNRLILQK